MPITPLSSGDKQTLALADVGVVRNALGKLTAHPVPPWLRPGHPYPDGAPPKANAAFTAVAADDLLEIIAVRGPLHSIDGWGYLGRALNALLTGQAHAARHLAYYAELRAALSILASAGIGVFNRQNVVVDAAGQIHAMAERGTHDMCWAAIVEWATLESSLQHLIKPIELAGGSLLDPFLEFFPAGTSMLAGRLMADWGFDLEQGATDRGERNWSSYQPSALGLLATNPADDAAFLRMFWRALRPKGIELERHLLRILLESAARFHGTEINEYQHPYDRLDDRLKAIIPFDFLTRIDTAVDHVFLCHVSAKSMPAHPYSMICRAGLLLKLATGIAEDNLICAGIQPAVLFDSWWRDFGLSHGLWDPSYPPADNIDLWQDIDLALEDVSNAPVDNRHAWISGLGGSSMRICEAERAALWGLFQ
ncbi:MAG: hypothetical protein AB7E55_16985 [Pigmentiphaga sp.]